MKNFKKRIERLEDILGLNQPLEEAKEPEVDMLGLTSEQRHRVREALESLEIKARQKLAEEEEKGIPYTPPTEEEKKRFLEVRESMKREALESLKKEARERETDK